MSRYEVARHETRHVFAALDAGACVPSVEARASGGATHVEGLSHRKRLTVAAAGLVGKQAHVGADAVEAYLAALQIVSALERVSDRRRLVARPRATEAAFAAIDGAELDAIPSIIAIKSPRARRLVEHAIARAEKVLAANAVAAEHFASALTARGSLDADSVLAVLAEALDLQDKESSCSNS